VGREVAARAEVGLAERTADAEFRTVVVGAAEVVAGLGRDVTAELAGQGRDLDHGADLLVGGDAPRVVFVADDDEAGLPRDEAEEVRLAPQPAGALAALPEPDEPTTDEAGHQTDQHIDDYGKDRRPLRPPPRTAVPRASNG
jgi:hypothetical protein